MKNLANEQNYTYIITSHTKQEKNNAMKNLNQLDLMKENFTYLNMLNITYSFEHLRTMENKQGR